MGHFFSGRLLHFRNIFRPVSQNSLCFKVLRSALQVRNGVAGLQHASRRYFESPQSVAALVVTRISDQLMVMPPSSGRSTPVI
jgi:hypothetical protein